MSARPQDAAQIQYNIVRVDGQPSVYLPVLKQGGDANTIAVVDGIRRGVANLLDVPKQLIASVVFDQSQFVRNAIENLIHEGVIGLVLTGIMILVFLGSLRATAAVFLSIPLSALAAFIALSFGDSTINTMILGGLALAFSRLIDNSVVVLENIFRHMEMGEPPAAGCGAGWRGSAAASAGSHPHHSHRFLPGDLSLRRQPIPVHRAGTLGCSIAVGFLFCGDDRSAALLRALDQGAPS